MGKLANLTYGIQRSWEAKCLFSRRYWQQAFYVLFAETYFEEKSQRRPFDILQLSSVAAVVRSTIPFTFLLSHNDGGQFLIPCYSLHSSLDKLITEALATQKKKISPHQYFQNFINFPGFQTQNLLIRCDDRFKGTHCRGQSVRRLIIGENTDLYYRSLQIFLSRFILCHTLTESLCSWHSFHGIYSMQLHSDMEVIVEIATNWDNPRGQFEVRLSTSSLLDMGICKVYLLLNGMPAKIWYYSETALCTALQHEIDEAREFRDYKRTWSERNACFFA